MKSYTFPSLNGTLQMEQRVYKLVKILVLILYLQDDYTHTEAARSKPIVYYSIPDKRPLKRKLGFIEDTYLNFTEITNKYGYQTEEHSVVTEDGYILALFRILPRCNGKSRGYPVMLMHGIYDSADEWILTGPKNGLGFILAKNCYDVWVANHRGNVYSRRHVRFNPNKDPEFWNYTFEEHGYYDLPALIDHVLAVTQMPKVNYVGHSQGTTDFFVMGSLRPDYNNKVQMSFHLSPIAWMKNMRSYLLKFISPFGKDIKKFLDDIGYQELFAKHQLSHQLLEFMCQYAPDEICGLSLTIFTGYRKGKVTSKNMAIAFGHLLAGISSKDLDHLGQIIASGRFQRYDYGVKENMKRYGSAVPPEYDVSKVSSAVVLICARNDWLSALEDIRTLSSRLPNVLEKYIVPDPNWSHNDQVYGKKAPLYVFSKILDLLNRYN